MQTSPVVSVHALALSLKIKYNSTFLLHRTGAGQIEPQQRPGSCSPLLSQLHDGEDVLQSFSLILPQFKAKSFTVEICQMNTFVYFQFDHCRYLQAVHTFIFGKDICGKKLSELFDVGS